MTIKECYYQVLERLNKLNTNANKDVPIQSFIRAMRKATLHFVRDRIKLGEVNITVQQDVQLLLTPFSTSTFSDKGYYQEVKLPDNWFRYGRLEANINNCNTPVYLNLVEETNINQLVENVMFETNIHWQEGLITIANNTLKLYKNRVDLLPFTLVTGMYYRTPILVNMTDGFNDVNDLPTININSDFEDDQLQIILDMTVNILASDINDFDRLKTTIPSTQINKEI